MLIWNIQTVFCCLFFLFHLILFFAHEDIENKKGTSQKVAELKWANEDKFQNGCINVANLEEDKYILS